MVVGVLAVASPVVNADEAAERVLRGARYASTLQHQDLHGVMRKGRMKMPISLFMRGKDIQFLYNTKDGGKRFHMRLAKDKFDLFEIIGKKTVKFSDKKISQSINNTDLSFEDLSMRFLYWKNSKIVGEERIKAQKCYKLRLINPERSGNYKIVYAWVHKKYGSLMRVIGYNASGQPLKKFEVTDLMRVGKNYTLKRMRVDSFDPKRGKSVGVTYLEFNKPPKLVPTRRGR